jgi:hydrogenase/urease accessory protein HupE
VRFALGIALVTAALLLGARAHAHDPFEITVEARLERGALELVATMARATAEDVFLELGSGGAELGVRSAERDAVAKRLFAIEANGAPLEPSRVNVELVPENDAQVRLSYPRPPPGTLSLRAAFFDATAGGVTCTLRVVDRAGAMLAAKGLHSSDATLTLNPFPEARAGVPAQSSHEQTTPSAGTTFLSYFSLGVEHILSGYDHLLFLAVVLLACSTLRGMLLLVTSFTLAHSLTLVAAALGFLPAPSAIVEPLILLTLVIVGIENFVRPAEPRQRAAITFAFGLVHGLGFASALRDIGLERDGLLPATLGFNLGVEAGQLAVGTLLLPLLILLRRAPWGLHALERASLGVALVAAVLLAKSVV